MGTDHLLGLNVLLPSESPPPSSPTKASAPAVAAGENGGQTSGPAAEASVKRRFQGANARSACSGKKRRRPTDDDDNNDDDSLVSDGGRDDAKRFGDKGTRRGSSSSSNNYDDDDDYDSNGHNGCSRYNRRQNRRQQHRQQQQRQQQSRLGSRDRHDQRHAETLPARDTHATGENSSENDDPRPAKRSRNDQSAAAMPAATTGRRGWNWGFLWFWRPGQTAQKKDGGNVAVSSPVPNSGAEQSSVGPTGGVSGLDPSSGARDEAGLNESGDVIGTEASCLETGSGAKIKEKKMKRSPVVVTVVLAPPRSGDCSLGLK